MSRRPPGHLLRWLLATMILVAGSGSPVRHGHAHPHQGEHDHHGGADAHDHDHDSSDGVVGQAPDLPALESGAFHWHDTFAPPYGLPVPNSDGTPTQVTGTTPWISGDVLPGTSALHGPDLPSMPAMTLAFDRLPPPPLRPDLRTLSGSARLLTPHLLLGSVPLRC